MSPSPRFANEIARLMRDPDSMRDEWERMKRSGRHGHYDPNQPRVPAGNSNGGRWTDTTHAATNGTEQRPPIDSALLADASLDDIAAGHLPIERVQARPKQRRFPNPFELADAIKLGLYNELSVHNGANQQAVIEFRAAQYRRDTVDVSLVAVLSRSELGDRCPLRQEVQNLTDEAVAEIRGDGIAMSPQQFGTAVHTLLAKKIEGLKNPDLHAEISFLKGKEEGYGVKDTIRIDALERVKPDTACIHDVKTGRRPLSFPRMLEMVVNAQKMYNGAIRHFIVTEVRPTK